MLVNGRIPVASSYADRDSMVASSVPVSRAPVRPLLCRTFFLRTRRVLPVGLASFADDSEAADVVQGLLDSLYGSDPFRVTDLCVVPESRAPLGAWVPVARGSLSLLDARAYAGSNLCSSQNSFLNSEPFADPLLASRLAFYDHFGGAPPSDPELFSGTVSCGLSASSSVCVSSSCGCGRVWEREHGSSSRCVSSAVARG